MQHFQVGVTGNESRWGVEPLSHAANSVMPLGPVRVTFSSCATADGDAHVPVEYAVLDIALERAQVGDHEVKSSVWPIVHRLHVRTVLALTGGGTSELLTVNQRDMLNDEFNEFIACVRGDGERKSRAAQGTAVAALESIAPEPVARLR
jgi:hypothetical protein